MCNIWVLSFVYCFSRIFLCQDEAPEEPGKELFQIDLSHQEMPRQGHSSCIDSAFRKPVRFSEFVCLLDSNRIYKKYTGQLAGQICRVSSRKLAVGMFNSTLDLTFEKDLVLMQGATCHCQNVAMYRLSLVRRWRSLCTSWRISSVPSMLVSVPRPDLESRDLWQRFFTYERARNLSSSYLRQELSSPTSLCEVAGQQTCLDDAACIVWVY